MHHVLRRLVLLAGSACLFAAVCLAQSERDHTPPAPQLSPEAAYQDAMHPLEVTRHNIANWSDVEIAAMNVAVRKAKDSCATRSAADYTGADLVGLARLCSLGQQWPAVVDAASRYIAATSSPRPLLSDAYIAKTEALLRLKQEPAALQAALTMLTAVPFSSEVDDCIDEVVGFMRFVYTADAITLAKARQPYVLAALGAAAHPSTASAAAPVADADSIARLYAAGLSLAALQQLAVRPLDAQTTVATLDAALRAGLPQDDALRIAAQRKQYALLGKSVKGLTPLRSLSSPAERLPTLPAPATITALLLFPDWCAECIRLVPRLPDTVFAVDGHSAYLYALLAETVPPRKPDPKITNTAFNPAYAAALLAETPTVTVAPDTLDRFEATDFPFLLLTDASGILRVMQPMGAQDLLPGGDLDAAIALVGRNFGHSGAPGVTPAAGSHPSR